MSLRTKWYIANQFNEVTHTTLNPHGPGCIRIHLVPAKNASKEPSVVVLNGMDIVPINPSWAILLNCLIDEINHYNGHQITEEQMRSIVTNALHTARKVFPKTAIETLKDDLKTIMQTLQDVAYGKTPSVDIGYMSIGEYAPFMKGPHRMDFMVTGMKKDNHWHCNQKCLHCYAAGQCEAEVPEMPTEDCKRVIHKLRQIGIPQITFTGGEPTMRDDLVELVKTAYWFVTRLNTNGVRLSQELCRKLHDADLDSVQITFYSDNEETHNTLVGAQNYHKTVNGIKNALDVGLAVSINTPLCTINRDYVSTLKFLHKLGVEYVSCSGLILTGNARNYNSKITQLPNDELYGILKEAVEYCNANQMEISFTSPGWIEDEKIRQLGLTVPSCGACLSNMAIAPNGDIVPCQSWLSDKPLGNILVDKWSKVWNSSECEQIRNYSAGMYGKCPLRNKNKTEGE